MRILYVADCRSPIAQNWIRHFATRGDDVYLASTFAPPGGVDFPVRGLEVVPVAFSALKKSTQHPGSAPARTLGLRTAIRQWFGPLTIRPAAQRLRGFVEKVKPDLIHAMRIPYEGMLAADSTMGRPLMVSTWGNDFTWHAPSTPLMRHYTRWTLQVADALHTDCHRDLRLAREWGFSLEKPGLVVPGNGGVRSDVFYPPANSVEEPIIINPRGFRPYVRNDTFFEAIPLVLDEQPEAKFLFASMAGDVQAMQWVRDLAVARAVQLLPPVPHTQMAEVFRRAQIVVSPSIHDGTPNSLLEGIACGCFPVAGDLESIREWIIPDENGLLFDPTNPRSIADTLLSAIKNRDLRSKAAGLNQNIVAARAEYKQNMRKAEIFYEDVVRNSLAGATV
jgi:glycosyltransferase involved in cell wall biosynthesis